MNRYYLRAAALALFLYLSLSPGVAAPREDRSKIDRRDDRIVRIVKKVKNFLRGITSLEDFPLPPTPKP